MKRKPYSRRKRTTTKSVLRLPDLERAKAAVLNSSPAWTPSGVIVTPSMNSLTGIVRNLAWLSTELQCCAIGLISNPVNLHLAPSIYVSLPCAGSHTRPPTAFSSEEVGSARRPLADHGAGPSSLASTRSSTTERKTRPSVTSIAARVRLETA